MVVQDFIADNAKWLDERLAANLSQIDDAAWPALLAGLSKINPGATDPGIDCDIVVTAETLSDFDASREKHWAERGARAELDCAGFKAVFYDRFQVARGRRRESIIVIDVGDKRVVMQ